MNPRLPILRLLSAGLLAGGVVSLALLLRPAPQPPVSEPNSLPESSHGRISPDLASRLLAIESHETHVAETTWAVEALADRCSRVFEDFWDALIASDSKLDLAAAFPFRELTVPAWDAPQLVRHGIVERSPALTPGPTLTSAAWSQHVAALRHAGWSLVQTEFRHTRFTTNLAGRPHQSRFSFLAHLVRSDPPERAALDGSLEVTWSDPTPPDSTPVVDRVDASQLSLRTRPGEPPFVPILTESVTPPRHSLSVDPLIVHDLDGDGFSEILLVARNLLFRREASGAFRPSPIHPSFPSVVFAAVLGDFDGDGSADLLCHTLKALELFPGSPLGRFEAPSRIAWHATADVTYPMVLTSGDIDRDGDLDVFLGQYKEPFAGGSTPTPFHASNDGYPAYLLLNDGEGNFRDGTVQADLATHRHRRTYSASFADLDADGDLDLLTVSDFAGLDLYRNDGMGRFIEITRSWVPNPHAFGMAHALADFNADGHLDLLMIGMTSATVDRLDYLGLGRPGSPQDSTQRAAMAHGNRLYLARPTGGFDETDLGKSIARSGWSWGCSAPDLDNDGFPDAAIVNGLESRATVRDYEPEYWRHDQHAGTSHDDPAVYLYYKAKIARTRGRGVSYGGFEKNRVYLNLRGERFLEAGHLFGVALEQDSRNLVADDLDGDGRMDLIVISFEKWPDPKPTLRIFRNTLTDVGHWIGFRFPDKPTSRTTPGLRVSVTTLKGTQTRQYVTGDSYRSQHPATLHFGLGTESRVSSAQIRWPDGRGLVLREPAAGRYHVIDAPPPAGPTGAALSGTE